MPDTFRYFYSWSGGGLNSLESQLRLIVVLGFSIPHIPNQKLLCLFLVCTSLDTFRYSYPWSRGALKSGVSAQTDSGIRIWHSLYTLPEVNVPISGVHLSDTFRYFYSWSGGGLKSGVSAQTDSGIRIWHSLYTLPEVNVPISGVHLSDTFRYFYSWSGGGLNSGVSAQTDSGIRIWHSFIYPTRSFCDYFWCAPL